MKRKDILVGTIKKCKDIRSFKKYGEKRNVPDFALKSIKFWSTFNYVDVVTDQAILIRVSDTKYIWLKAITSLKDEIMVNLGLPIKVLSTTPSEDNELYIDDKNLTPYYKKNMESNIHVRKLKKDVLVDPEIENEIESSITL